MNNSDIAYAFRETGLCKNASAKRLLWFSGDIVDPTSGRHFRININDDFQMGDDDFCRWANSVQESEPVPKTRRELISLINSFRERASQ